MALVAIYEIVGLMLAAADMYAFGHEFDGAWYRGAALIVSGLLDVMLWPVFIILYVCRIVVEKES